MTDDWKWADFRLRLASAAVMVPLSLAAIRAGGGIWLATLTVLGAIVAIEWQRLCAGRPGAAAAGIAYVILACFSLDLLRQGPWGVGNVLFVMVTVWVGDIAAYAVGRLIGGPRLWPSLSPGKTWAGAAGGLAGSIVAGSLVAAAFGGGGRPSAVAALLGLAAQAGDLLESALKRWSGAKDSGGLIPGHGGLLDRVDGLMAAALTAAALWLGAGQRTYLWQ